MSNDSTNPMNAMQKRATDLKSGDRIIVANQPVTVMDIWDLGSQVLIFCDNGYCYNVLSNQLCVLSLWTKASRLNKTE